MRTIRRVAVLGAGTMGARIAAHFANAGVPSLLLDIVLPDQPNRNAAALKGLESAAKQKPVGFMTDSAMPMVKTGNFDDNLSEIYDCDWIIEAVTENLAIKRDLYSRVDKLRSPGSIVSTNTSGIPLRQIAEHFSEDMRRHFLGTHFFNPPRYLHLLEIIPGPDTDPAVLSFVEDYADRRLGKGVVLCKDTPNFIANRIGSFFGGTIAKVTQEGKYTVEEVDALTGPLIGLPNSASFRLLDIVGLDTWAYVGSNLYEAVPNDPWRERFLPTDYQKRLLEKKWLGEKSGQGFYKRVGKGDNKEIQVINLETLEYGPAAKVRFPSVDAARQIEDLPERLRTLTRSDDRAGNFLWSVFSDLFLYSAEMVPEISDNIYEIDRAMRWGYANKFGPFELWDALGFDDVVARLRREGRNIPQNVQRMIDSGAHSFYIHQNGHTQYFDLVGGEYRDLPERPGIISLAGRKAANGIIQQNSGASLIDLGDGVLCCEFHTKMNALGDDIFKMLYIGLEALNKDFDAMVIANEGENFSVGANLMLVLLAAQSGEWDELDTAIGHFQQVNMALKYAPKPVVSAPFARTLGGGCEIALHTHPQAAAELYMGLVEVGVGLIPAGGGCKELLARLKDPRRVFELIGYAKVSASADDAKQLGLLDKAAPVSMNGERLVGDAKAYALSLIPSYTPGAPRTDIKVTGTAGLAMLKIGLWSARRGNYITDYDVTVGEQLGRILTGGNLIGDQLVSEQYLLDLEREAFLSLCGNAQTQERMQAMLKTGKPLRN